MEGSNSNNNNNNNNNIFDLLLEGCELAKKLECDLPNLASSGDPLVISQKCDQIIAMFGYVKEQLASLLHHHHQLPYHHHDHQLEKAVYEHHMGGGKGKEVVDYVSIKAPAEEGGHRDKERGTVEVGGSSSLAQQKNPKRSSSRSNEDEGGNRRVRMAAPQIGNTEMPPEDGFTWRKYGQKEILNAKYPRSYYRCTHQKLYDCQAKKQVQRLDDDPNTMDILYRGNHTCLMSSTAPSAPPPSSHTVDAILQPISTVVASHFYHWPPLTMDPTKPSPNELRDQQTVDLLSGQPILDWNEVFHSGSSGSNSMEVIFPLNDDNKWDNRDIKD